MIEQNAADTLERARFQIRGIASAKTLDGMMFHWTWTAGYLVALFMEKLVDADTKLMLDIESDRARDTWVAPTATGADL
jgi:hypothetical protein